MRFANHNQTRIEAVPKAVGTCPACAAPMVAKCGDRRIWHWAHKGRRHCDPWWENETPWHREWKSQFPVDWQEVPSRSAEGELHIADIRTPSGLVVEFQHSAIGLTERQSREVFYGNMVWVLDGLRLGGDASDFFHHLDTKKGRWETGVWSVRINPYVPRITRRWIEAARPVYLDFGTDILWRVPVEQDSWWKTVTEVSRRHFVTSLLVGKNEP